MIYLGLQVQIELPEQDVSSVFIGLAVIVIFIALLVFVKRYQTTPGRPASRGRGRASGRMGGTFKRYNKWVFRRMALSAGLNKNQLNILERLIQVYKVNQPFLIFTNARLLDNVIKRNIYFITQNFRLKQEEREKRLGTLFQIKQQIEHSSKKGVGITSTNLLRPGQTLVLSFLDGKQYRSEVLTNQKTSITCAFPYTDEATNEKRRWLKGNKLKVLFWRENDSGYVFNSKILGLGKDHNENYVYIQHSESLKRNQQRKFRRRPIEKKCFFYPIEIVTMGKGYQMSKKALVHTNSKHLGNINDIGAGGCSIQSQNLLEKGQYVKVTFTLNMDDLTVYGRVRRITKPESGEPPIMHVMFTKVASRDRNQIYQYVYNYI